MSNKRNPSIGLEDVFCPYCESKNCFEAQYGGAFPHVYRFTCTECGVSGPLGDGDTEEEAKAAALTELFKFLRVL